MSFFGKLFNKEKEESSSLTKEQKMIEKKLKNLNHVKYGDKRKLSAVEIENQYFGNGVFVKDSSSEKACYIDILSGFNDKYFGNKRDGFNALDIFIQEDKLDYVLTSLEQIYKKADQIMEECYDEIYKEIIEFFELHSDDDWDIRLKNEFDLGYLKENWNVSGKVIYDDHVEISIGIEAAENPEHDEFYQILVSVDYSTQEPQVSFDVVF